MLLCLGLWALVGGCEELVQLIDSISDGAECRQDTQCLGGRCLSDREGFPGGYCTTAACPTEGCTNIFGSECLLLPAQAEPFCYEACADGSMCRPGYDCFAVEQYSVCLPLEFERAFAEAGTLGAACANEGDCNVGTCLTNVVGGYCTTLGCAVDADCDPGRCLVLGGEDANGEEEGSGATEAVRACFRACANDDDCRFGYDCADPDGEGGVCQPTPEGARSPVRNPSGLDDGAPCTVDINCKGGTCLREAEGYPGGACTTLDCAAVGCNAPDGAAVECVVITQDTACFLGCQADADCREGYVCAGAGTEQAYCSPPRPGITPDAGDGTIDVVCSSEPIPGGRALSFEIQPETSSFTVVPVSDVATVRPTRLLLPDGSVAADFDTDHRFLDVNPLYIESAAPVFFPALAPFAFITELGGGTYTLEVRTTDPDPCHYVIEKSAPGARLDVNIYFVGVRGLSAATASSDAGFSEMLEVFTRIYRGAGIEVGEVRTFDVSQSVAERYAVIRNLNDIGSLVGAASNPGPTLDERLSVDVFFIDGFAVPQAPGLLGLSLGIPGVPGFHGVAGSALVFTAEYLSNAAGQTGQTLAHELGHFNGLRHTSEHGGEEWDPYEDTPECSNPDRGRRCPDAGNLMFPFSLGNTQESVSEGQAFTLRSSPHIR